jgi:hypothetical protein
MLICGIILIAIPQKKRPLVKELRKRNTTVSPLRKRKNVLPLRKKPE